MALSSTTNRISYTGDGTAVVYAYTFKLFLNTDLKVVVSDDQSPPTLTTLTLTTDYTVSNVGNSGGGNVTLVDADQAWINTSGYLKSGYGIHLIRNLPLTQTDDIRNQGSFFPETHEKRFDRLVMVDQRLSERIDRAVSLPESLLSSSFNPVLPGNLTSLAGYYFKVNSSGTGITLDTGAVDSALESSWTIANATTGGTVTGLVPASTWRSFVALIEISRKTDTYGTEVRGWVELYVAKYAGGSYWEIIDEVRHGDVVGVDFTINASTGQILYTSSNFTTGSNYAGTGRFRTRVSYA